MIGLACIAIDGEEFMIGNAEEIQSLIFELKPKMQLSIRWLGKLEIINVCSSTLYRCASGTEKIYATIYCKKVK